MGYRPRGVERGSKTLCKPCSDLDGVIQQHERICGDHSFRRDSRPSWSCFHEGWFRSAFYCIVPCLLVARRLPSSPIHATCLLSSCPAGFHSCAAMSSTPQGCTGAGVPEELQWKLLGFHCFPSPLACSAAHRQLEIGTSIATAREEKAHARDRPRFLYPVVPRSHGWGTLAKRQARSKPR